MITDHVFRRRPPGMTPDGPPGSRGGSSVPMGMCNWLGTCGQPEADHITVADYRAQQGMHPHYRFRS